VPIRLQQYLSRFRRDKRGNVAIIFAIAAIPLISAIGCAVDYSMATRMKAKLQSAADSASIAALSQKSPGFLAASVMTGNGTVAEGVTDATNVFNANMNGITGYTMVNKDVAVTKTGIKLAASVTFTAEVPTTFLKVINYSKLTVTGLSSSAATLPPYLDFYLTLDVSGSMGLPSTAAEQTRLSKVNPDNYIQYPTGCTFACHFAPLKSACIDPAPVTPSGKTATQRYPTNNACMGYSYSRVSQSALTTLIDRVSTSSVPKKKPGLPDSILSGLPNSLNTDPTWGLAAVSSCTDPGLDACIQLRADAVGFAVSELLKTAKTATKVDKQFRIGLYPFIQDLYAYSALTDAIDGATITNAAKNLATQLDTNMNSSLGSGGTWITTALTKINTFIYSGGTSAVGDGSTQSTPLPYVFLVTDGAQVPQTKGVPNGSWGGSNHATTIDKQNTLTTVAECKALKDRGIVVAVLYIPYQPISPVNKSFAGDEDTYANDNIPFIPASLQKCASPDFYFTANTPADITTALNKMFNKALEVAHITN
jgi:Flp pilus assembly protein TadG